MDGGLNMSAMDAVTGSFGLLRVERQVMSQQAAMLSTNWAFLRAHS